MEDISRDLEKEIAKAKPKPYKQYRETSVLIVDDSGEMKSGEYLKVLARIFMFASLIGCLVAAVFCYFFVTAAKELSSTKAQLISVEKKLKKLSGEKEELMARLVIIGKAPDVPKGNPQKKEDDKEAEK